MACDPEILRRIPLLSLLDQEELLVLAAQVELRHFAPHQRIYRLGDCGGPAYLLASGRVRVLTIDEDQQEVLVNEPQAGSFIGLSPMLAEAPHQTEAVATEESQCIELTREDLLVLIGQKPVAALDLMAVLARELNQAQRMVRERAARHPNQIIEEAATRGDRIADAVARFGGSWTFIICFAVLLVIYTALNVWLGGRAWDPYPFILLNLFLSMLAALQAPIIMMSQNRQDAKDRVRSELDFEVNLKAESEIQSLSARGAGVNGNSPGSRRGDIRKIAKLRNVTATLATNRKQYQNSDSPANVAYSIQIL